MKTLIRIGVFLWVSILFAGCGIGGFWMNGNPFLTPVTPYLHYWEKPRMTVESRMEDWVECGGASNGNFSPRIDKVKNERRPEEKNNWAAHDRLWLSLISCMKAKGYRYVASQQ